MSKQVTLYNSVADTVGKPMAIGEVLFTEADRYHTWRGERLRDSDVIIQLRGLDREGLDYDKRKDGLKKRLQCFTPAGLLQSRAKGRLKEHSRTGLLQLDFDAKDIARYDLTELKQNVFKLPFIAYCALSCSGKGFYALACIAEPEKLAQYAEHLFEVFRRKGITIDASKGRNVHDLRYMSYDSKHLVRANPDVLKVTDFLKPLQKAITYGTVLSRPATSNKALVKSQLQKLSDPEHPRIQVICRVAYTLGGIGDPGLLDTIKKELTDNEAWWDDMVRYIHAAEYQFEQGAKKLLGGSADVDFGGK